jgi:hypothetical protein
MLNALALIRELRCSKELRCSETPPKMYGGNTVPGHTFLYEERDI